MNGTPVNTIALMLNFIVFGMNSRERVNKTFRHEEPDKVPLDLGGNQSSIHIKAYKRLLEYLDIEDKNIKFADFVQQITDPCEEVL